MALPATDTFTTASDQALTTYSANWSYAHGTFTVFAGTDRVAGSASDECGAYWNADTFNAAQYSQAVAQPSSSIYAGICVRGGSGVYYGWYGCTTDSYLFRYNTGDSTPFRQLGSTRAGWSSGKTYRLEIDANYTLTCKEDGVQLGTTYNDSGSSYKIASGAAGLSAYGSAGDGIMDNWEGGNLGAAATKGRIVRLNPLRLWTRRS